MSSETTRFRVLIKEYGNMVERASLGSYAHAVYGAILGDAKKNFYIALTKQHGKLTPPHIPEIVVRNGVISTQKATPPLLELSPRSRGHLKPGQRVTILSQKMTGTILRRDGEEYYVRPDGFSYEVQVYLSEMRVISKYNL